MSIGVTSPFHSRKGTEDHTQQESEEPVVDDVVHTPKDYKDHQNQVCPSREVIQRP